MQHRLRLTQFCFSNGLGAKKNFRTSFRNSKLRTSRLELSKEISSTNLLLAGIKCFITLSEF